MWADWLNYQWETRGKCRPLFRLMWSNPSLGIYSLVAQAAGTGGLVTNYSPVAVTVDNRAAPRLFLTLLSNGTNAISGEDLLGRNYRVQSADNPSSANWQTIGALTGDVTGVFQIIDSTSATQPFDHTVFP